MNSIQILIFVALTFARVESNFYPIPGNAHYYSTRLTATTVPRDRNLPHVRSIYDNGGSDFKSPFHSQSELGQYTYAYDDGHHSKIESKTQDEITRGSYSYVNANGVIRNVNYVSDDVNKFWITAARNSPSASSLSTSSLYVYQFPIRQNAFLTNQNQTQPKSLQTGALQNKMRLGKRNVMENIIPSTKTIPTPSTVSNTLPTSNIYPLSQLSWYTNPVIPITLATFKQLGILSPVQQQFHAQDELGQYSYGYSGGSSTKVETKTSDGITRGGYSYMDPNGILQTVNYVSDPINGFRVAATNLPTISNVGTASYPNRFQWSY